MSRPIPKSHRRPLASRRRLDGTPSANGTAPAATPEPPLPPVSDGRATGGRFAAGNKFGKGNPFARRLGAMRSAFLDSTSADDVQVLARRLLADALAGDTAAAALWLSYAVGKPRAAVDPDALDLDEFKLIFQSPTKARLLAGLMDLVPPAAAVELLRDLDLLPADGEAALGKVLEAGRDKDVLRITAAERKAKVGK